MLIVPISTHIFIGPKSPLYEQSQPHAILTSTIRIVIATHSHLYDSLQRKDTMYMTQQAKSRKVVEKVLTKYINQSFDLYISCSSLGSDILYNLQKKYSNSQIVFTQKRGGDVFGFLDIYKKIKQLGYKNIWR